MALAFHTPATTHVDNRSCWRKLQEAVKELWKCWSEEYLVTLQEKNKWTSTCENLKVGTIVILKDPGAPQSAWKLARIIEIHHGLDNKVRVIKVKTSASEFTHSIARLAPLPDDKIDSNLE
ncbi:uncharacterized protein LOC120350225 [Nilaparvata lugens]|uniref:uncharacterized protein LOC120350225 n=1 Tax=Nilaparvata lugens TaxID=108931 RepID=UPI00193DBB07|nr:uncharacterized protein LOC120350225 [Nilaparvata lugens]